MNPIVLWQAMAEDVLGLRQFVLWPADVSTTHDAAAISIRRRATWWSTWPVRWSVSVGDARTPRSPGQPDPVSGRLCRTIAPDRITAGTTCHHPARAGGVLNATERRRRGAPVMIRSGSREARSMQSDFARNPPVAWEADRAMRVAKRPTVVGRELRATIGIGAVP